MKVSINKIRTREGRRSLDEGHVKELAESIRGIGLINPLTIDRENILIAGLHRLEAVRLLGWTEVECTVSSLEGLQAELAEIDENFVRNDLSAIEYSEMLLRRKEIYESLYPETRHGGDRKSEKIKCAKCTLDPAKSFVNDTAEKLKVDPCTVRRQLQTARNLTPETKEIMKNTDTKISKKAAMKLSRLEPDRQKEAATLLAAKEIRTVEEYTARTEGREQAGTGQDGIEQAGREPDVRGSGIKSVPSGQKTADAEYQNTAFLCTAFQGTPSKGIAGSTSGQQAGHDCLGAEEKPPDIVSSVSDAQTDCIPSERQTASFRDLVAELKDPDKDCSGTPESFLEEYAAFVRKFHREIGWYNDPYYDTVYPRMDSGQLASLREMTQAICSAAEGILHKVERMMKE